MPSSPPAPGSAPVDSGPHGGQHHLLHRGLGVGAIVFMVLAAAAPLAVIAGNLPVIIGVSGSIGAPMFFLATMVILLFFSVGFTLMSRYVRSAGAFYSYIQAGLGRIPGVGAATLALCSYTVMLVAAYIYVGVATSNVVSHYAGTETPWWFWTLVAMAIVAVLGYRDIELSSKVLGVILIVETLTVLTLDIAVIVQGGADGLSAAPFSPAVLGEGSPGLGLMFAFFGFFGFEATAVFRTEAKDPARTIPRATYIAVIAIGLFYAFSSWAVIMGQGVDSSVDAAATDPENMILNLARSYVSPVLFDVMQVLVFTSYLACSLSFHNVITRYLFTLGDSQVLPQSLGAVHGRHRAPSRASLVMSIGTVTFFAVAALSGREPITELFAWFSGAATLGIVALMAGTCLAVIVFFRRTSHDKRPWNTLVAPGLGLIGLATVLYLTITNLPMLVGSQVAALIVAGLIIATAIVGCVIAVRMRANRPDAYRALAGDVTPLGAAADPAQTV